LSKMRLSGTRGILAGVLVAGVSLLAGCGHGGGAQQGGFPPAQVSVVTVRPANVPEAFDFPGQVEPYREVQVRARVSGIIETRPFTEGSIVHRGQLLYQIDPTLYEAAVRSAQAHYDNAVGNFERLAPLLDQHAVAEQDVDNARFARDAAKAALDAARKDLADTRIVAEMTGRVGSTMRDVGARVTGPADLLTTIDRVDPVYVTFQPSSQQILEWRENAAWRKLIEPGSALQVQVVLPDSSVYPRTGRLDFVAPALDSTTGTQEFRAVFANPELILVPGQFVQVRLVGFERTNAIAVPQRAVLTTLGQQFVYVVGDSDVVSMRTVVTGPWSGDRWIIDKGLASGDRVIVDGMQKVAPGRPVKPVPLADSAGTDGAGT
jgi:membrane fusion protein (multidrug efflux system)